MRDPLSHIHPSVKRVRSRRRFSHLGRLVLALSLLLLAQISDAAQIAGYRVIRQPVTDPAGKVQLAIRSFLSDGVPHLLVVDPYSLKSSDLPASSCGTPLAGAAARLKSTPYLKAVDRYTGGPFPLQNAGATHAALPLEGMCLTVDLCPSRRPFEREMFEAAASLGKGAPVPVAVAITGAWLDKHPEELAYLRREVASGKLAVTWVNHSDHHPYDPGVPLAENFLLKRGTDFDAEVLEVEQKLLSAGLVPSPFFRFPGLVSDRATVTRLRELSLIPIGSDAWLAKGEMPRKGSFILVHGNGNEPKGIKLLLPMLKKGELRLLPLSEALGVREPTVVRR